jgi:hypothetical protein
LEWKERLEGVKLDEILSTVINWKKDEEIEREWKKAEELEKKKMSLKIQVMKSLQEEDKA